MALPAGFPAADEVLDELPNNTAVTEEFVERQLDAAYHALVRCHHPSTVPNNATTQGLVWDLTYARAFKHHFIKGEGNIETPAADTQIERAELALEQYCIAHQSGSITDPTTDGSGTAGVAYIERTPW